MGMMSLKSIVFHLVRRPERPRYQARTMAAHFIEQDDAFERLYHQRRCRFETGLVGHSEQPTGSH